MANIVFLNIEELEYQDLESYLKYLNEEEQLKIQKYHFEIDKVRSLSGWLLAQVLLSENCKPEIQRDEYNRPQVIRPQGKDFNLTHDGNFVGCAISEKHIGLDVMDTRQIYQQSHLPRREQEIDFIKSVTSVLYPSEIETINNNIMTLCYFWTAKEAILKCLGCGFEENVCISKDYKWGDIQVYHYQVDSYHIAAFTEPSTLVIIRKKEFLEILKNGHWRA
eukprot:NODE_22_length_42145_cov_1.310612.p24 type:complete len:221 gc:universal NODE_22_length_42145_cov_1.310612:19199-18537(-)